MTAAAAVEGIRLRDPVRPVTVISLENHPPYDRPPLSKGLWAGKPVDKIWRKLPNANTEVILGRRVVAIDPARRVVHDDAGETYTYQKLLLATGGAPRRLPFGGDAITYYRTFDDYRRLRRLATTHTRFGVIGGGFIGSEIAAALRQNGCQVTMIFPEAGIGANVFPPGLAAYVTRTYQERGVKVLTGHQVVDIRQEGSETIIQTNHGAAERVDHVIAGIGIRPNIELAEAAGLGVENGVLVDAYLQTTQPGIYAAGDVANFFAPSLGRRMRVEHEDNALQMGRTAGQNMAGDSVAYTHLPLFYSDLFDLGYEAVGLLNPAASTIIEDWFTPYRQGILYYLQDGCVCGVLLWNVWGQADFARRMIGQEAAAIKERSLELRTGGD